MDELAEPDTSRHFVEIGDTGVPTHAEKTATLEAVLPAPSTAPATETAPLTEAELREDPWYYLKDFFTLVEKRSGDFKTYQCVLCQPKVTKIKAHASTTSHLKSHVTRQHPGSLGTFETALSQGSRRGKRPSGEPPESPAGKRGGQMSIAAWASGAGSGALQSGVDKRIVDYFVANMLSLQVHIL
jgi:hypothetical protein